MHLFFQQYNRKFIKKINNYFSALLQMQIALYSTSFNGNFSYLFSLNLRNKILNM